MAVGRWEALYSLLPGAFGKELDKGKFHNQPTIHEVGTGIHPEQSQ